MKKIFFLLTSLLTLISMVASAKDLAPEVLLSNTMSVGFAPPEHVGLYSIQLLRDGKIQSVNNKGVIVEIGKLDVGQLKLVSDSVEKVPEMVLPPQPPNGCFDAPSIHNVIQKQNGTEITISANIRCFERVLENDTALMLLQVLKNIALLTRQLDDLGAGTGNAGSSHDVIAKSELFVGFAPPEHTGRFSTLVHADGSVKYLDNHNQMSNVLLLDKAQIVNLLSAIEEIKKEGLTEATGPQCADAPSLSVSVKKSNNKILEIYKQVDCRNQYSVDEVAPAVAEAVDSLNDLASSLNNLRLL